MQLCGGLGSVRVPWGEEGAELLMEESVCLLNGSYDLSWTAGSVMPASEKQDPPQDPRIPIRALDGGHFPSLAD